MACTLYGEYMVVELKGASKLCSHSISYKGHRSRVIGGAEIDD